MHPPVFVHAIARQLQCIWDCYTCFACRLTNQIFQQIIQYWRFFWTPPWSDYASWHWNAKFCVSSSLIWECVSKRLESPNWNSNISVLFIYKIQQIFLADFFKIISIRNEKLLIQSKFKAETICTVLQQNCTRINPGDGSNGSQRSWRKPEQETITRTSSGPPLFSK